MSELLIKSDLSLLNDRILNLGTGLATMPENGTMQVNKVFLTAILGYMEELLGICHAQPANEPLTLEQLREMEQHGEGIYVTHADGSPIFRGKQYTAAVLDRIAAFGAMGYHLQAIYGRGLTLAEDDYEKTWFAYRRPPERSEQ